MPQPERVLARIQSLDERLARLRTEKNRLIARAGHAERKRDTRRKILIGGAVLAKARVPAGRQRSGGQGCPSAGTAKRREASLTAA